MLINLILKNIRSVGSKMLQIILSYTIFGGLFIREFYDWEIYMMYGYLTISWMASALCFAEKKSSAEVFSLSLPVTRSSFVISRYLTSLFIIVVAFFLWYLAAYGWDAIFNDEVDLFYKITYMKVGFMAILFLSVQQSLFLPFTFRLNMIGMGIIFVIATVIPVYLITTFFAPYKNSYNPYFTNNDLTLIIVFSSLIIILPILSFALSHSLFNEKDL